MDVPTQNDERPKTPQGANLLWTPEIERAVETWRQTGKFPFPEMHVYPQPLPQNLSVTDLRLIHHVCSVSSQMQTEGSSKFAIWTQRIPMLLSIASSYNFVMHSLLALSATHLAWITKCPITNSCAYHHRGIALKGLQEAIGNFSRENSDAVLAASILLSWQAGEWRGWASLMQGTSSVIDAMRTWKHESQFADFINEQATFPNIQSSPIMGLGSHRGKEPRREDLAALEHTFTSLQRVGSYLAGKPEETQHLNELMTFIRGLRAALPVQTPAEQFELLQPLRAWLLWLPIAYSRRVNRDPSVALLLAHFYAVALAVEPLFPVVGAAYFGSLSVGPIEEIYRKLARLEAPNRLEVPNGLSEGMQTQVNLMQFPLEMVAKFRVRMDFVPKNSGTYPSLASSPYDVESLELDAEGEFVELESSYEGQFNHGNITPITSSPASGPNPLARRSRDFGSQLCHSLGGFDVSSFVGYSLSRDPPRFVTSDGSLYDTLPMDFGAGLVAPTLWT